MLTDFANKPAHVFKNPAEEVKARRQVIIDYCRNLLLILSPHSLKTQVYFISSCIDKCVYIINTVVVQVLQHPTPASQSVPCYQASVGD